MSILPLLRGLPYCLLALCLNATAESRRDDPLAPLMRCVDSGEFHVKQADRWPQSSRTRELVLASGKAQVSVADGYRLMVYRNSTAPLVNLKIERSEAGQFAADRKVILDQMTQAAAASKPANSVALETSLQGAIEILALNNPVIAQASGVISFYTLFDAASGTVATAYVLNQRRADADFTTDAEYAAVRARFIDALADCMAQGAAPVV